MQLNAADPHYYLANFELMLASLSERDGDLLSCEESGFMAAFARLPTCSRALLVRLLMRKGPLFRASRLRYAEIGDIAAAASPLLERHWLDDKVALSPAELLRLYSKAELVTGLALPAPCLRESKATIRMRLDSSHPEPRPAAVWGAFTGTLYCLVIGPLCARLRCMFFGNARQELSEFILADLGILHYETAGLDAASRPFATRSQVDAFHRLNECRELLATDADPTLIEPLVAEPIAGCDWLEERRERLRFRLGRAFERKGSLLAAQRIYDACPHPDAQRRAQRLRGAAGRMSSRSPARPTVPTFEMALTRVGPRTPVEREVMQRLIEAEREATQAYYVETALLVSLFGLLYWPAVFAPVPGAFFHPFQHAPADLTTAGFHRRRERELHACRAELEAGSHRHTILRRFAEKRGRVSPFVAWGLLDAALIEVALDCIPASHLRVCFDWMLEDLRANCSGFPDLVHFWPDSRRYRLVEVKAPGDRLQTNQRRCFEQLLSHGLPASVCRVRWQEAEFTRRAAPSESPST